MSNVTCIYDDGDIIEACKLLTNCIHCCILRNNLIVLGLIVEFVPLIGVNSQEHRILLVLYSLALITTIIAKELLTDHPH